MSEVPAATPVTTPLLFTVATDVLAEVHGLDAAAVPEPVSVVVPPAHTVSVPEIVAPVSTVTVACAEQPLLLVYVIDGEPAATPVTTPPVLTVAWAVFDEVHGLEPAGVPEPVRVTVEPEHTVSVPDIVGSALMVTVACTEQPLLLVYVIADEPEVTPVTTPALTVATAVLDEVQGLEPAGVPEPVRVVVAPTHELSVPDIVGAALTVTVAVIEQPLLLV